VIIVAGVAQALALLARVLGAGGIGCAAMEDPGSLRGREQLRAWGVDTLPVQAATRQRSAGGAADAGAPKGNRRG
jgi:GntR family transcriptional regulator/MocR family aminotransferase